MTVYLVTFSDESMMRSRHLCLKSALANGVNATHAFTDYQVWMNWEPYTIEHRQQRGKGFWMWKPWVVSQALEFTNLGDFVIYSDAGVEFIAPVSHIIDRMDQDIFLFGNNWEHAHWCKRDVIQEVWPMDFVTALDQAVAQTEVERHGHIWNQFGKQVQASVIFFRVSDYTRTFVKEWLDWCLFEGGRLIDDSPSRLPNHPEFQEHRHDQAILTTMAYRDGIKIHYWPASYNGGAFSYEKLPCYASDEYPILFNHHRKRNHEWPIGARYVGSTLDGEQFRT